MNDALNLSPRAGRVVLPTLLILAALAAPSHTLRGAEGRVPAPLRAFHPAVNSALYLDLESARKSGVWAPMAERFRKLGGALEGLSSSGQAIPGMGGDLLANLETLDTAWLKDLGALEFAEILVVGEGDMSGTDLAKLAPDDSFLVLARLSRPLEDQEAFIQKLMAGLNTTRAGTGERLMASRTRSGAADLFAVPPDLLTDQPVPFPLSLGIGPGEQGTVLALGRTDRLEAFLGGKTAGDTPARLASLMPRRGQFWLYSAIPPNASKALAAAGPPELATGPGAGALQVLDQLRDIGLNLSFGASAIDVQAVLGCAASDVATQMAQQAQGFLGMMKMMGGQAGSQVPGFLTRLTASASGAVFTLATSLNPRDVDQLANLTPGGAGGLSAAGAGSGQGRVIVRPLPDNVPPVTVEFLRLHPNQGGHIRQGRLRLQNDSDRPVRELRLTYDYLNARGSRLGTWTRQQIDPASETLLRAKATREMDVPLFSLPPGTEGVAVTIQEVIFTDGEKWVAPK